MKIKPKTNLPTYAEALEIIDLMQSMPIEEVEAIIRSEEYKQLMVDQLSQFLPDWSRTKLEKIMDDAFIEIDKQDRLKLH